MKDYKCITKTTTKGKKSLSVASQFKGIDKGGGLGGLKPPQISWQTL